MKKSILVISIFLLPLAALAAGDDISGLGTDIMDILNVVKNVIFALAFVAFFWGLLTWFFAGGDKKEDGKKIMLWGILALFIMFSIWGIISILQNSFAGTVGGGTEQDVPLLPDPTY